VPRRDLSGLATVTGAATLHVRKGRCTLSKTALAQAPERVVFVNVTVLLLQLIARCARGRLEFGHR